MLETVRVSFLIKLHAFSLQLYVKKEHFQWLLSLDVTATSQILEPEEFNFQAKFFSILTDNTFT